MLTYYCDQEYFITSVQWDTSTKLRCENYTVEIFSNISKKKIKSD